MADWLHVGVSASGWVAAAQWQQHPSPLHAAPSQQQPAGWLHKHVCPTSRSSTPSRLQHPLTSHTPSPCPPLHCALIPPQLRARRRKESKVEEYKRKLQARAQARR